MTSVIAAPISTSPAGGVSRWPSGCIDENGRAPDIQPDGCADRGAGKPVGPAAVISFEDELPAARAPFTADNTRFPTEASTGAPGPPGCPDRAAKVDAGGVDPVLVAGYRQRNRELLA